MTAFYPSQVGYPTSSVGMPMAQSYGVPASYAAPAGGVIGYGAPTMVPGIPTTVGAPVVIQPSYNGGYGGYGYNPYSFGSRIRRFFGFAPGANVRYRNDRSTWGFMGYSRRQRYIDARTGGEVDREGRPVFRI